MLVLVPGLGELATIHRVEVSFIAVPAVVLCVPVIVVLAPESINFTKLFQSESVGTCQPTGQMFKVSVLAIFPVVYIPFAAYQLYR